MMMDDLDEMKVMRINDMAHGGFGSMIWHMGSLVLGFSSISPIAVVARVGPLSGKGSQLSCLRTWITFCRRKLIHRWPAEASCGWSMSILLYSGRGPYVFLLFTEMYLFAFISHSNPTKVRIGERGLAEREVGLLMMTKGCIVPLSPLATTAPEESHDSIKKLFDDADQEHAFE
uniref:Uncharacterized protein n=1 Tax=Tanacetum cinerariifolium TaxID=118510 RepID=A0A699GLC9_TANCI|nr:hypothetical protein [Tanacetum cinerariifolium]